MYISIQGLAVCMCVGEYLCAAVAGKYAKSRKIDTYMYSILSNHFKAQVMPSEN